MPEISRLSLEANPGMIGGTTVLAWIVADVGLLLMPVQGQHRGIQVEDDTPSRLRALPDLRQQPVVGSTQLGQAADRQSVQEAPQGDGIGISRQPRESLEDTIAAQEIRGVQTAQSQHDRIQEG